MHSCKRLPVFFIPALYVLIPQAYAAELVTGAEALSMGGAAVAAPSDNSGITLNPGTIGLEERYDMHGTFRFGPDSGLHWGANAVDARTAPGLALGLAYSGDRFAPPLSDHDLPGWTVPGVEPANRKRTNDFTVALAAPLFDRKLSVGINGSLSMYNHDRIGKGAVWNLGVGAAARPVDWLVIGVSARNLLPLEGLGDQPLAANGGVRFTDDSIGAFEVDVGWTDVDSDPWTLAVGAEKTLGQYSALRAGFRRDGPLDRRDLTFGIGFGTKGGARFSYGIAVPIGKGQTTWGGLMNQVSLTIGVPDPSSVPDPF